MTSKDKQQQCYKFSSKTLLPEPLAAKKDYELLFLLKELVDDEKFFLVCRALFHEEFEISIGAALVLGHIKDKRALPFLLRALLSTDKRRAQALMWALGEMRDDRAVPFLLSALEANFAQKSAVLALGKIGSIKTLNAILTRLSDEDESMRALAAKALNQIHFGANETLILKTKRNLCARLGLESSRRVKLLMAVAKNRLENKMLKH